MALTPIIQVAKRYQQSSHARARITGAGRRSRASASANERSEPDGCQHQRDRDPQREDEERQGAGQGGAGRDRVGQHAEAEREQNAPAEIAAEPTAGTLQPGGVAPARICDGSDDEDEHADGTDQPFRMKIHDPSFVNMQLVGMLMKNNLIADTMAVMASLDPVMGGIDK